MNESIVGFHMFGSWLDKARNTAITTINAPIDKPVKTKPSTFKSLRHGLFIFFLLADGPSVAAEATGPVKPEISSPTPCINIITTNNDPKAKESCISDTHSLDSYPSIQARKAILTTALSDLKIYHEFARIFSRTTDKTDSNSLEHKLLLPYYARHLTPIIEIEQNSPNLDTTPLVLEAVHLLAITHRAIGFEQQARELAIEMQTRFGNLSNYKIRTTDGEIEFQQAIAILLK